MKLFRPKSIIQLILIGFAVVALPLIIALLYAATSVDKLAAQSQQLISDAVTATEASRMLVEQVTVMERNLRQYQILRDEKLLRVYEDNRASFITTTRTLAELPLPEAQWQLLSSLVREEADFYNWRTGLSSDNVSASFARLAQKAQQILQQSQHLIDAEVERTQVSARQAQRNLFWLASALVPTVLILLGVVVVLIRRPLRQLDDAVHRLGSGDFSVALKLEGPRDLEQLGERLDWMRNRLMEVDEDKKRLLRHISHELKTPLTTIREGSELLAEEIPGDLTPQQREIVELLRQNGLQLQRLIEDLLNYNAAIREASLTLQPVRLDELVSEVVGEYKVTVMARQLWFELELAEVTLLADAQKLRIIIDNLLSNAVKYSPDQGRIKIRLSSDPECAMLEVMDQGAGISPEQQDKIFEAFYQGSGAYVSHVNGTGLGLSIVREYLIAHGGRIEVVNDGQPGAHLRVCLPLQQGVQLK